MKHIRISALILLMQTILWIILMAITTSEIEPGWGTVDYMNWAASAGPAYVLNYINVSLLTLVVVVFFAFLYTYLKEDAPYLAPAAMALVPVYGIMNLVVYTIQIHMIPSLAAASAGNPDMQSWVAQLIQAHPESLAGFVNGLAYAVLGIASIIYGRLLISRSKPLSGWLLLINGVLCILGIAGSVAGIPLLSLGTLLGGVFFLLSLGAALWEFRSSAA
jgi:hypothetical protein